MGRDEYRLGDRVKKKKKMKIFHATAASWFEIRIRRTIKRLSVFDQRKPLVYVATYVVCVGEARVVTRDQVPQHIWVRTDITCGYNRTERIWVHNRNFTSEFKEHLGTHVNNIF